MEQINRGKNTFLNFYITFNPIIQARNRQYNYCDLYLIVYFIDILLIPDLNISIHMSEASAVEKLSIFQQIF